MKEPLAPTDDSFVLACLLDPEDSAPRLIYSDWLDDHGWPWFATAALRTDGKWRITQEPDRPDRCDVAWAFDTAKFLAAVCPGVPMLIGKLGWVKVGGCDWSALTKARQQRDPQVPGVVQPPEQTTVGTLAVGTLALVYVSPQYRDRVVAGQQLVNDHAGYVRVAVDGEPVMAIALGEPSAAGFVRVQMLLP